MSTGKIGVERRARLAAARLYLVCDSRPGGREISDVLRAAIAGGVDVVQLRDKRLSDEQLAIVAQATRTLCAQLGALFIVNDRPLVALQSGADGVHVGQQDMPVAQVRELVGSEMLIGLSTHTPAEIDATIRPSPDICRQAESRDGADNSSHPDYIGVGPVHATPTKPGRPAVGLELVRHAVGHAQAPCFAIGGIDAGNLADAIEAGARRVAVVRAIAEAADPERAARALRVPLDAHPIEDAAFAGTAGT